MGKYLPEIRISRNVCSFPLTVWFSRTYQYFGFQLLVVFVEWDWRTDDYMSAEEK